MRLNVSLMNNLAQFQILCESGMNRLQMRGMKLHTQDGAEIYHMIMSILSLNISNMSIPHRYQRKVSTETYCNHHLDVVILCILFLWKTSLFPDFDPPPARRECSVL